MKLEIARGLFLVGALGVTSMAFAAWNQDSPQIISGFSQGYCPMPVSQRPDPQTKPDHDLLLFMFGMSQGLK
ncbi:hypothetical protein ACIGCM_05550 [Pseudomonas sp. NPDC078700]|uniref:hypothetical protein n=1 Tax=Pseudomonas sp. NPDC078700 TaxID=3364424 RepID=UPI0037CAFBA6